MPRFAAFSVDLRPPGQTSGPCACPPHPPAFGTWPCLRGVTLRRVPSAIQHSLPSEVSPPDTLASQHRRRGETCCHTHTLGSALAGPVGLQVPANTQEEETSPEPLPSSAESVDLCIRPGDVQIISYFGNTCFGAIQLPNPFQEVPAGEFPM